MELAEMCPWAQSNADDCGLQEIRDNEQHVIWHLEREVRDGNLVKNDDGSYSLKE